MIPMGVTTAKRIFENMDVLAGAMPDHTAVTLLVRVWRRRTYGFDVRPELALIRELAGPLWAELVDVTLPDGDLIDRWEHRN